MNIPFFDPNPMHDPIRTELHKVTAEVIDSGAYILGSQVSAFESEIAKYLDVPHAIGVNSGTDALVIALLAAGVKPGDEVIVPSWTFFATSESVVQVGAIPVFVDIRLDTFLMDLEQVEQAIGPKTKAVIPVHLYGRVVEMSDLATICASRGIALIEDTAQGFGATFLKGDCAGRRAGSVGIGAYSFFPTKNLGGVGDGGLVTTHDDGIAETVRKLRAHGSIKKYKNEIVGFNSRLDAIQAAVLRVKLPHVDDWNQSRRSIAAAYNAALAGSGCECPEIVDGHVFHQYTLLLPEAVNRDAVAETLQQQQIPTMVYYPIPNHKLPVFEVQAHLRVGELGQTREAAQRALSLPMYPFMPDTHIAAVANALKSAL